MGTTQKGIFEEPFCNSLS